MSSSWLIPIQQCKQPGVQLFCIPYAGGGASIFRNWKNFLGSEIRASAIQPPGRETRFSEAPILNFENLTRQIADSIEPHLNTPFAIFGHSLGAAVAFELCCELERRGHFPAHIFLSGRQSPDLPPIRLPIAHLPDDEFLFRLKEYNSTPKEIFENKELVELLLPMLKADFYLAENYHHDQKKMVAANISACGSLGDPWLNPKSLNGWQKRTAGSFTTKWFNGAHLYLNQETESLVRYIQSTLNPYISSNTH